MKLIIDIAFILSKLFLIFLTLVKVSWVFWLGWIWIYFFYLFIHPSVHASSMCTWVHLTLTTPAEPCTTTSTVADVAFVVDTSGSICDTDPNYVFGRDMNCNNFEKLKTFLKDIVSSLNVGPNANRVALVIFRTTAYVAWPLDRWVFSVKFISKIKYFLRNTFLYANLYPIHVISLKRH